MIQADHRRPNSRATAVKVHHQSQSSVTFNSVSTFRALSTWIVNRTIDVAARNGLDGPVRLRSVGLRIGESGFQVGDPPVLEAQVGAGGLQPLVEGAVVGGELADPLFESGVLGGDPLDGVFGPLGLQVADLTEEFADAGALGEDLGVGGLEAFFGVQRPLAPRCLSLVVLLGGIPGSARASGLS